ncbi:MAG: adenylosuccinate lyase [Syntrophomonadaceae bacterium]|nr:adenylosuccinate lyase [Syntrophomonadaceae bacterium]
MIARYTLPEMAEVWSEENKLRNWLKIEIAACEGWAQIGVIPQEAVQNIKERARFDINRIREIETVVNHDVIAFLTNVAEYVGDDSKYIHLGMTSSDILDTGLALQMRDAADIILAKMHELKKAVAEKALKYKYTYIIGRTHGVHGEPTTFGHKMAVWYMEIQRNIERMGQAREVAAHGAISGAVGNLAHLDPRVEEYTCQSLGLKVCPISTQVIQRDRHAQFLSALALIASSLEKMATEIRNLQRTEILEVEESFKKGQKGSSAMPHKRNPMVSERVTGLARIVRSNALVAMENVALWHERDLTHSSVERIIIPDSCILLDYMLSKFIQVIKDLIVYQDNMMANIYRTRGLVFSQPLLLALIGRGMLREDAYRVVQRNAMIAWEKRVDFKELIINDQEISGLMTRDEIENLFNLDSYLKNMDYLFKRCGLE